MRKGVYKSHSNGRTEKGHPGLDLTLCLMADKIGLRVEKTGLKVEIIGIEVEKVGLEVEKTSLRVRNVKQQPIIREWKQHPRRFFSNSLLARWNRRTDQWEAMCADHEPLGLCLRNFKAGIFV